ncbi:putative membrane protein [Streptomyces himastatinicus ATCC 53653]|uniref:protein-serine/threonine phosphatase n=1 Tax=Streptomyces himastatinicus ATCC 53653 TaxID=457427 RepID=D9WFG3_9ACTN|nr:putative membrane protein [Streptomyces himastatinicus ATCC 53653]
MRSALGLRSVAGQVCALMLVIVTLLVLATGTTLVLQARSGHEAQARGRALAIADTLAAAPGVRRALESRDPSAILQPYATRLRRESGVGYIVVTSPRGIRYAHPDPKLIGTRATLPLHPATAGRAFTDENPAAPLSGPSIRAAVPVTGTGGRVVGIVNVGVVLPEVSASVSRQLPVLYGATALALVLGAAGAALVGRRLRRLTHRLDPAELTRMYEHHDAVLRAVREGVLILDGQGRLVLANDEARRLLGLPPEVRDGRITEAGLTPETAGLLASGRAVTDEVIQVGDRLLAVNQRPASRRGQLWGSVATLRDTTELQALTDKADAAWARLELLYDASVRVGTSLDMTRTAEELGDVAVPRFADFATVDLLESVLRGEEPVDARSRMRRVAVSAVREERPRPPSGHTLLAVPLSARGVLLGQVEFRRLEGAAPFDDEDRSFADELVGQAAVAIDNARRYAREHATALALQQSLLPRGRPEQYAVEAAYRYLPAHAGVGGDWFDIIPLSGARVALVVGDVVGHGLHAAATMGRLRTAVHNFSVVDLPPDELLTQLDDVVAQLDQEEAARNGGIGAVGASCLYAVYDPVAQRCTLARAGHPPPAVVDPGGTVTIPDLPAGPPLGLGGRLFEVAAIPLPAGSRLVLYTNGLVQDRERDIDTGLDLLRRALGPADPDPGRTCDAVMGALLPPRPTDDVVLLVARTTALDERHVASWDLPPDPSVVAGMRAAVSRTLADWNLDEAVFTTELVVSELLGNAIRHADGPIRLRLLRNRTLICEVADGSSTSPHLRRAAITDEGGRGLFLVAQMVQRWGTRYTSEGKIIWAEQDLPRGLPEDLPSALS